MRNIYNDNAEGDFLIKSLIKSYLEGKLKNCEMVICNDVNKFYFNDVFQ